MNLLTDFCATNILLQRIEKRTKALRQPPNWRAGINKNSPAAVRIHITVKLTGRGLFFYNNSEKLLSQILVYFLVFFLPVITDGSGQFLGGNGNPYIYKIHVLILCHELCLEFAVYQFVKIALNRGYAFACFAEAGFSG